MPIKPPTCTARTEFPYSYANWGPTDQFELPTDPNCTSTPGEPCNHYINNLSHVRAYLTNPWTDSVDLLIGETRLGTCSVGYCDDLFFATDGSRYTGNWANEWAEVVRPSDANGVNTMTFNADFQGSHAGFHIDKARLCTTRAAQRPSSSLPSLQASQRGVGFLQGTNDVVYFTTPHTADHLSIAVWAQGTLDTDLYVGCTSLPTLTSFSYASRTTAAKGQEYLDIPSSCQNANGIYVAVHSRNGLGAFNVAVMPHLSTAHRTVTVNKNWSGSPDNSTQWKATLTEAAKRTFAATEGNVIIDQFKLYKGPSCELCGQEVCAHCYKNVCCGAGNRPFWSRTPLPEYGNRCAPWSEMANNTWFDARVTTHEFLHEYFCIDDEYAEGGSAADTLCGHSMMANHGADRQYNVCVAIDHGTDQNPLYSPSTLPPAHTQAVTAGVSAGVASNVTPDNYDYVDFDFSQFDNKIGVVTDATNTATLVVGNTTLSAGDTYLKTQLTSWGFAVTVVKDSDVTASGVANQSLVVISESVLSTNVNTKLRDIAVPIVCFESSLFDDLQMTGATSSDFGSMSDQTQAAAVQGSLLIGDHECKCAPSTMTLTTAARAFGWGLPGANALVGLWIDGAVGSKAVSFGYLKGDAMATGMVAPARRVGVGLTNAAMERLSTGGQSAALWGTMWSILTFVK